MHKKYVFFLSAFLLILIFLVQVSTALSVYHINSFSLGKDAPSFSLPKKHSTEKRKAYYSLKHLFVITESNSSSESSLNSGNASFIFPDPGSSFPRSFQTEYFIPSSPHYLLKLLQVFRV